MSAGLYVLLRVTAGQSEFGPLFRTLRSALVSASPTAPDRKKAGSLQVLLVLVGQSPTGCS